MRISKSAGYFFVLISSIPYAADVSLPDTAGLDTAAQDTGNGTAAVSDSGTTDSTVTDSIKDAVLNIAAPKKPEESVLPEVEIASSRYVEFLNSSMRFQGEEAVFEGNFVVLGKAVFGHFTFVLSGDSGSVIGTVQTDDRAYRSDKGGRVKLINVNMGSLQGCRRVKVSFQEMREEAE